MMLLNLLRTISSSHIFGEKLRTALSLVGVSLGIALYSAIRLANFNAFESFADSAALLRQGSELSLISNSGRLDESVVSSVAHADGITAINPISSRVVSVQSAGEIRTAQLFGMDVAALGSFSNHTLRNEAGDEADHQKHEGFFRLFGKPYAALVSPELLSELNGAPLKVTINGESIPFEIAGELPLDGLGALFGGRTVLIDIATYQEAFQDFGSIDELELKSDGRPLESVEAALRPILPANVTFSSASDQQRQADKLTAAFRLNLNFLAGISLLVGVLLIYNSVSYTTLRRRSEFGIMRALGAKKSTVLQLLATEALVLGLIASACGLCIGFALSFATVKMVGSTFTSMYLPLNVAVVRWSPEIALEALLIGPIMTLLAAILPSIEALAVAPRQTFSYQNFEDSFRTISGKLAISSRLTIGITILFSQQFVLRRYLLLGFVSPTFLVISAMLLVPKSTELLIHVLRAIPALGFRIPLALDHVTATLKRNSVAIASVAVALGMFIGMTIMISSFRDSVTRWIEHITTADLYINTGGLAHSVQAASNVPERVIQYAMASPEVQQYDWVLKAHVVIEDQPAQVIGVRFPVLSTSDRYQLKNTASRTSRQKLYEDESAVFASEAFATKFGVSAGDSVILPTRTGSVSVTISDIFFDYTSEQGVLMMSDAHFANLFGPTEKESLSLYLQRPAAAHAFTDLLQHEFPDVLLTIRDNESLRSEVLQIFDQTFRITHALRIMALIISGITIFNTILILIIERAREFAILRAIGASTRTLKSLITTEAVFLGAVSSLFGTILGIGLALILVFVVNKFFFGWSVSFSLSPALFVSTAAATVGISWFVAVVASLQFKRKIRAEMLRYE